jgi:hypothetical protein
MDKNTRRICVRAALLPGIIVAGIQLAACDFNPASEEYDQVRYEELQKTNCNDIASFAATSLMGKKPEDEDEILERCRKMKALTFTEYKLAAQHARETGEWDLDKTFPDKRY